MTKNPQFTTREESLYFLALSPQERENVTNAEAAERANVEKEKAQAAKATKKAAKDQRERRRLAFKRMPNGVAVIADGNDMEVRLDCENPDALQHMSNSDALKLANCLWAATRHMIKCKSGKL